MTTQLLTVGPTSQLDAHFNGIRIEFDRLNRELDEARKQRDEYKTNYRNQERELREIIKTLLNCLSGKDQICQHCRGDITHTAGLADDNASISPPSPSSEYYSPLEEEGNHDDDVREGAISAENEDPTIAGITSPSLQSDSEWDIMCNGETEITLKLDLVHEFTQWGTSTVAFSPDGKYLAIIPGDLVGIFDVNTGERVRVIRVLKPDDHVSDKCLDFSSDYNYLATGDTAGEVRIWIISQRRARNIFTVPGEINDLHFSPYGQHLVTASSDGTVRIWRLRDGFSIVLPGGQYSPLTVRFSPDGKYVASGCIGQILIWNVRTRRLVARWEGHGDLVSSLVFTPDGKGLLTASDKTIVCWDIAWLSSSGDNAVGEQDVNSTVTEISRFVGHTGRIYNISISPDGKWIASGSFVDRSVRIWNTDDATLQWMLRCTGEIWSVAFSPVGTYLAIGGWYGVAVWNYTCITAVPPL